MGLQKKVKKFLGDIRKCENTINKLFAKRSERDEQKTKAYAKLGLLWCVCVCVCVCVMCGDVCVCVCVFCVCVVLCVFVCVCRVLVICLFVCVVCVNVCVCNKQPNI